MLANVRRPSVKRAMPLFLDLIYLNTSLVMADGWMSTISTVTTRPFLSTLAIEGTGNRRRTESKKARMIGWSTGPFEEEGFIATMEILGHLCQRITVTCEATIFRRRIYCNRKQNYWDPGNINVISASKENLPKIKKEAAWPRAEGRISRSPK